MPIAISKLNPTINYAHADNTGTASPQTITATDGPYTITLSADQTNVTDTSFRYTVNVSADAVNFDLGHFHLIGLQYKTSDFSSFQFPPSEETIMSYAPPNATAVTIPTITGSRN